MPDTPVEAGFLPHSSHWGAFSARYAEGRLEVRPHPGDPDPNGALDNFPEALRHRARIATPMVRRGWLEDGPGPSDRRGRDEFVAVSWDRALDLLAAELRRVGAAGGPDSIFGGSYGWASAGRFHHAQSQVHRFLNITMGGYVRSVNSYSAGAAPVILPHVVGSMDAISRENITWEQIAEQTEIVLGFGGMALKNLMVASGGVSRHVERGFLAQAHARGCEFVGISPIRTDMPEEAGAEWLSLIPGTDTALMLGIAHTLVSRGLHDQAFLDSHCAGWTPFEDYLLGRSDGVPKTAAWAAAICGVPEEKIIALTLRLPGRRVLITMAHALQRVEHGEQPVWMAVVLAAMLGQIGLPGGGFNYAFGSIAHYGKRTNAVKATALPQGRNRVSAYIPVARIADMLLHPGETFTYDGHDLRYPEIKLVYWAGGNPWHHHQDLNRLRRAFARIDTLVVHESAWTATARHADIVLPVTMTLEREDIGTAPQDPLMIAMHQVAPPHGESRDDFAIFADLAERLGLREAFTAGRDARQWLRHFYEGTRAELEKRGEPAPSFEEFWAQGEITLPQRPDDGGVLRAFRADPEGAPLATPSGKVEISSAVIAGFGYADCPGHPTWMPQSETPDAAAPFWLVANQPETKLHSQLDFGGFAQARKQRGREPADMHPADAAALGLAEGDIIRISNGRGACLAGLRLTDAMRPGVIRLPTGAWYDPEDAESEQPLCVHGNPNVLTRDIGTSSLSQGCTGQICTVRVEPYRGNLPPIRAYDPPEAVSR